jgi:hypothetical protein
MVNHPMSASAGNAADIRGCKCRFSQDQDPFCRSESMARDMRRSKRCTHFR